MRIRIDPAMGLRNTNLCQQITSTGHGFFVADMLVNAEHFSQLVADCVDRIQGRHWVLKNHGNA